MRAGFTLLELMIVLGVLVAISVVAWPQLQPGFSRSGYRSAALQLKADLAEAREQAIHEGQIREFRYKPGTGRYLIAPVKKGQSSKRNRAGSSASQIAAATQGVLSDEPELEVQELPHAIIFRRPVSKQDQQGFQDRRATDRRATDRRDSQRTDQDQSLALENLDDARAADSKDWVLGTRFFPDGRATEEIIELEGEEGAYEVILRIRGLTGGVKIGPVEIQDREDPYSTRSELSERGSRQESAP